MMNATPSLADIAAVTDGNRNNDGFGNGNGWSRGRSRVIRR